MEDPRRDINTNIMGAIDNFIEELSCIFCTPVEDIKIILPHNHYVQLIAEVEKYVYNTVGSIKPDFFLNPIYINRSGVILEISSKDIEDNNVKNKLQEHFKLLIK